ncbi:hypothetical protein EJB05_11246 [Eragrostis curvula]|uniref:Uncharacterized protein n=1 Tax=Eragrostis curvula TaxID=38414 RepID=A0A5J9VP09_9POAL|nr:hypothetical protein EJB05_11246 [Eragrostis curvula]
MPDGRRRRRRRRRTAFCQWLNAIEGQGHEQEEQGGASGGHVKSLLDMDDDTLLEQIAYYFDLLKYDPPDNPVWFEYTEQQLTELYQRLAFYRIRGYEAVASTGRCISERVVKFSSDFLLSKGYFKCYEEDLEWYFDPELCWNAYYDDYQRLTLCDHGEYRDWDRCHLIRNTYEQDLAYVQYCEEISNETKWIDDFLANRPIEWKKLENVALLQALKVGASVRNVPISLFCDGLRVTPPLSTINYLVSIRGRNLPSRCRLTRLHAASVASPPPWPAPRPRPSPTRRSRLPGPHRARGDQPPPSRRAMTRVEPLPPHVKKLPPSPRVKKPQLPLPCVQEPPPPSLRVQEPPPLPIPARVRVLELALFAWRKKEDRDDESWTRGLRTIQGGVVWSIYEHLWSTKFDHFNYKGMDSVYFEIWKRVSKQNMDFTNALSEIHRQNMFPSRSHEIEYELKGKIHRFSMKDDYDAHVACINETVSEDHAELLIKEAVIKMCPKSKTYVDYARKKLGIAKDIGMVPKGPILEARPQCRRDNGEAKLSMDN